MTDKQRETNVNRDIIFKQIVQLLYNTIWCDLTETKITFASNHSTQPYLIINAIHFKTQQINSLRYFIPSGNPWRFHFKKFLATFAIGCFLERIGFDKTVSVPFNFVYRKMKYLEKQHSASFRILYEYKIRSGGGLHR